MTTDDQQPVQPVKTRQGGAEGTQSASSDPLSLRSLRVGDEAVIVDPNHLTGRCRVARISRKYLYISDRCKGFDLDTGVRHDDWGNTHAYTPATYDRQLRVAEARCALRNAHYSAPEDRLLAIHDTLKAAGLL